MQLRGWRHLWDGELQRALSSLDWFPEWLDEFKAVLTLLRNKSIQEALCKHYKSVGLAALGGIIEKLSIPFFTEWRWCKVTACLESISEVLDSIINNFDMNVVSNFSNSVRLDKVSKAFGSKLWRLKFEFVRPPDFWEFYRSLFWEFYDFRPKQHSFSD